MGMFDTIRLEPALVCPACGHEESRLQTHLFGETLSTYRVGMIVPECPVLTGILREAFWCSACHNEKLDEAPELFVVIWHTILVGVEWKQEEAERRLASVDRASLIGWMDRMQQDAREWRRKYHALRTDLDRWHKYVVDKEAAGGEEPDQTSVLRRIFMPDEELRNAADPLETLLKRHSPIEEPEWF